MLKSIIAFTFFSMLMSFTPKAIQERPYFKHIDITFTSSQGCTFRVVGEATINVWKLKLTSFSGTITLGGVAGCPTGTYNVNYSTFKYNNINSGNITTTDLMTLQFDTDDVCNISTVNFNTDSQAQETQDACVTINNTTGIRTSLIDAIKEGECQ